MRLKRPVVHRAASVLGVALILGALALAPIPSLGTSSAQSPTCILETAYYEWRYLRSFDYDLESANMVGFHNRLFFKGRSGDEAGLWVADGKLGDTHLLWEDPHLTELTWVSDYSLAFSSGELWKTYSNGDTEMFVDIHPNGDSDPEGFTVLSGKLFFSADDGTHGREPWLTGIRPESARMLMDINFRGSSAPEGFAALGGQLFFSAHDGTHGRELWVTDGTSEGTRMLLDINPGSESSDPEGFTALGDLFFFSADDGSHGRELWVTDGTWSGTRQVGDLYPDAQGSDPSQFAVFDGRLLFSADDGTHGRELWMVSGKGAAMVEDINPGPDSSEPQHLTAFDDRLFFSANDGSHGHELWAMDRSLWKGWWPAPYLVKDINPGYDSSLPAGFTAFSREIFFTIWGGSESLSPDLWATDGTEAGTSLISEKDVVRWAAPWGTANGWFLYVWTNPWGSILELWALQPIASLPDDPDCDFGGWHPWPTPTPVL